MSNVLLTSLSALRTAQRALATTSHNIANVNTPGYSRQRVSLGARMPTQYGFGAIGNGVQINGVQRSYDAFLAGEVTNNLSEYHRLDAFAGLANRLGALVGNPDTGLSTSMQAFFGAASDVANDPSSLTSREAMLGESRVIVERFNQLASQLNSMDRETNSRIAQEVADIDGLAGAIADINRQIVTASGGDPAREPSDLLDQRGVLVNELASKIGITTSVQENGALNVFFGSGQPLVVGNHATEVSVKPHPLDPSRVTVHSGQGNATVDVTGALSGGTLGGLLGFAGEGLTDARNQLGLIATAFASGVNAQHRAGMDLDGALGGDFFVLAPPAVTVPSANTGTATVTGSIADAGALTASDYVLAFDGSNYSVSRAGTGESVPFTGTGTAADPILVEGVELVVTGTPAAGDEFGVEPLRDAASHLGLALDSARQIAAAFPVRTAAGAANTGNGAISTLRIADPTNPSLLATTEIRFLNANTYQINGAGSFTYTPGDTIGIHGAHIAITGAPQAGDTFTIESNDGGIGDNRNMLAINTLANEGLINGGLTSINDAVGQLVANSGVAAREAGRGLEAQAVLLDQSEVRHLSVSGVSLDEEAADMLRYQATYEAAAQMIQVADSLFATLINAVRR